MNTELTPVLDRPLKGRENGMSVGATPDAAPSADFVRAVSDFFDTDPADLLSELGYYDRSGGAEARALAEPAPAR